MQLSVMQSETRRYLGGLTATDYSNADILLSLNRNIHDTEINAILASGSWEVQGEISTANIVSGRAEYVFPGDLIALKKVEVNPTGSSNGWSWAYLHDLRNNTRALSNNTGSQLGASPEIDVYDTSLFFKDLPTSNVSAGLKIYWSKEQTDLVNSYDETTFPEFVNLGLIYGACFDFCVSKPGLETRAQYFERLKNEILRDKIREYYANRLPAQRPRVKARAEKYN